MEDASQLTSQLSSYILPQTLLLLKSIPNIQDYNSTELLISLLSTLQQDGFTHYNSIERSSQQGHSFQPGHLSESSYRQSYTGNPSTSNQHQYNTGASNQYQYQNNQNQNQNTATSRHYLRRLSDSSGSAFVTDIVLVFVCIICAGFASGNSSLLYILIVALSLVRGGHYCNLSIHNRIMDRR